MTKPIATILVLFGASMMSFVGFVPEISRVRFCV